MSAEQKANIERIVEALKVVPVHLQGQVADAVVHDIGVLAMGIAFGQAQQ